MEILTGHDATKKQNYFTNKGNIIIQKEGLAMGAPFAVLFEVFLQYMKSSHIAV
jgi:hypothetical protein